MIPPALRAHSVALTIALLAAAAGTATTPMMSHAQSPAQNHSHGTAPASSRAARPASPASSAAAAVAVVASHVLPHPSHQDELSLAAPVPTASAPTVELTRLNTEGVLLEARLRNAKLQAEIDKVSQPLLAAPLPAAGNPDGKKATTPDDDLRALSISAYDGHYEARLHVAGQDIAVRRGDHIANGWQVDHIDDAGVTLVRAHERRVLRV
ncbi:type IV pilus biogenesis protein PilP [Paraburkholderia tropica]|uniref:type IV pilus biogenesis protein PilP n=1 Tax=Paraburkholderia tropica TaxID=92647 RepID=UPI002AB69616|nr:type IV pilus biogenesis protein PilP [Paraburkholderia tropica]